MVKSTSADKVIPALAEIYNIYGNSKNQLSDKGLPFNSILIQKKKKEKKEFCQKHSINIQKTLPLHPSSNLVETFMKPLGKTMKIAHKDNTNDIIAKL